MLEKYLIPDKIFNNVYEITPEFLQKEGIRALIVDIDNTLVTYDDKKPTDSVLAWFKQMDDCNIKIGFVSNNHAERVTVFNEGLGYYAHYDSKKPSPVFMFEAMKSMGSTPKTTASIGDQLLTDCAAAKRAGMKCYIVPPIKDKTTPFFKAKRLIEKPYIRKYYKRLKGQTK